MINQVFCFILFSFLTQAVEIEGCNLNDIKTIIGGSKYIVKSLIVESLTYSSDDWGEVFPYYQNTLIAAGNLETLSPTKNYLNFIFLYDYDSCTTYDFQTFEGEEIKAIVSSPNIPVIYLIGCNNPNESI